MNQAECAAIRFGVRAFQDSNWDKLEDEREMPAAEAQLDLEQPGLALSMPKRPRSKKVQPAEDNSAAAAPEPTPPPAAPAAAAPAGGGWLDRGKKGWLS